MITPQPGTTIMYFIGTNLPYLPFHVESLRVSHVWFDLPNGRKLILKPMRELRDIICLPLNHPNDSVLYSYPRGKIRTQLAQRGLIGKIKLKSWMNQVEIKAEIISCFAQPFGDDPVFPFKFLQSAGIGAKSSL